MPLKRLPLHHRACFMARWLSLFNRPRRAEAWLTLLLQAQPAHAHARAQRSVLRHARGAVSLALADARALVAAHPQRAGADWYNLGYLLETAGAFDEAATAFAQAVALSPRLDLAWYGLGLARLRAGQLDEAVAPLTECTRLQPMSPHAWYQLARLHAERGRPDEAHRVVQHLAGFEPGVAERLRRELGDGPEPAPAPMFRPVSPSSAGRARSCHRAGAPAR